MGDQFIFLQYINITQMITPLSTQLYLHYILVHIPVQVLVRNCLCNKLMWCAVLHYIWVSQLSRQPLCILKWSLHLKKHLSSSLFQLLSFAIYSILNTRVQSKAPLKILCKLHGKPQEPRTQLTHVFISSFTRLPFH